MRRFRSCLLAVLCAHPVPSHAGADAQVSVTPELGTIFGATDLELRFAHTTRSGDDVQGRSLLEWPLDFVFLTANVDVRVPHARMSADFVTNLSVSSNLGEARSTMEDTDWIWSRSRNVAPELYAVTESETASRVIFGEASFGYRVRRFRRVVALTPLVGYRHEWFDLLAIGATGSYPGPFGQPAFVMVPDTFVGVRYRVNHALPFAGLSVEPRAVGRFTIPSRARLFYLYSHSFDDHRIRGKEGVGHAHGAGMAVAVFPTLSVRRGLDVGLAGELFYFKGLNGVLEQSFYRDDPATDVDERTISIVDSKLYIESLRMHVSLFLRVTI